MFECELRAAASSGGGLFVWPVRLDSPSAVKSAEDATAGWVRVVWDTSTRAYTVEHPEQQHPDPIWPVSTFEELLERALKDNILDSREQPAVWKMLGESAATMRITTA